MSPVKYHPGQSFVFANGCRTMTMQSLKSSNQSSFVGACQHFTDYGLGKLKSLINWAQTFQVFMQNFAVRHRKTKINVYELF